MDPQEIETISPSKKIFKNVIFNQVSKIITKFLGLIFTIYIARLLQPELFGLYSLVLSVVFILLTLTDLGINTALIKYVSSNLNNKKRASKYFTYLLKIKIILAVSFSIILLIIAKPLANNLFHKPELFPLFLISSAYVFIASMADFFYSLFYAFSELKFEPIKEVILQVSRIIFVFSLTFLLTKSLLNVIIALILSNLVVFLFVYYIAKKRYIPLLKNGTYPEKKERKKIWAFIFYLTLANISAIFFSYVDTIMLGMFLESSYVGFYRAAFAISTAITGILGITNVLFPVFSYLKHGKLEETFNKAFKYSAMLSLPAAFGLIFVAKPFVVLIYGSEYALATIPLYILSFLIITATGNLYPTLFSAKEKAKWPAKMMIIASIINIVLNFVAIKIALHFFTPTYAIIGSAIATLISNIFFYASLYILAKKKLAHKLNLNFFYKPFIASVIMAVFLLLFNILFDRSWFSTILEIIFGAIIYFISLKLFNGINKEDFLLFKRFLGR